MRDITRRRTVQMLSGLLGCACVGSAIAQFPEGAQPHNTKAAPGKGPDGDPQLNRSGDVRRRGGGGLPAFKREGCSFAGYGAGQTRPRLSYNSGMPAVDEAWDREGKALLRIFQVTPAGGFLDDSDGPNAYATNEVYYTNGPDGTVMFGVNLLRSELSRDHGIGMSIPAITAHEFAHICQFKDRRLLQVPTKYRELHADFLAGWYMAIRHSFSPGDLTPVMESFFEKGDYHFNSPGHHGTPPERLEQLRAGMMVRSNAISEVFNLGIRSVGL